MTKACAAGYLEGFVAKWLSSRFRWIISFFAKEIGLYLFNRNKVIESFEN